MTLKYKIFYIIFFLILIVALIVALITIFYSKNIEGATSNNDNKLIDPSVIITINKIINDMKIEIKQLKIYNEHIMDKNIVDSKFNNVKKKINSILMNVSQDNLKEIDAEDSSKKMMEKIFFINKIVLKFITDNNENKNDNNLYYYIKNNVPDSKYKEDLLKIINNINPIR